MAALGLGQVEAGQAQGPGRGSPYGDDKSDESRRARLDRGVDGRISRPRITGDSSTCRAPVATRPRDL